MIKFARKIAEKSNHRTHRHSTLILKGGRLLAAGYNHDNTHSEYDAIIDIPINGARVGSLYYSTELFKKLKGSWFINTMLTRSGKSGMSRPCDSCWGMLKRCKVGKVTYFNGETWITERIK